jgi:hypothetical protein
MTAGRPEQEPHRGIHITGVYGAFAIGDHNNVVNQSGDAPGAAATRELLTGVLNLRADLARVTSGPHTEALAAELAQVQAEIERTGQAGPNRRERLRRALEDAGALTAVLASAAAVAQAVGLVPGA